MQNAQRCSTLTHIPKQNQFNTNEYFHYKIYQRCAS